MSSYRFIDWVIQLPQGLDEIFWREVAELEEAEQMPYITASICGLPSPHLPILLDVALSAEALPEVAAVVTTLIANTDKVNPSPM